jgi:hypothetical protein
MVPDCSKAFGAVGGRLTGLPWNQLDQRRQLEVTGQDGARADDGDDLFDRRRTRLSHRQVACCQQDKQADHAAMIAGRGLDVA